MQNPYQESLVRNWKNVKKVADLPNSPEDPVRTMVSRSSSDRNFPGRAGRTEKVRKMLLFCFRVESGLSVYRPEASNILESASIYWKNARQCSLRLPCPALSVRVQWFANRSYLDRLQAWSINENRA